MSETSYNYFARQPGGRYIKIGISRNPERRLKELGLESLVTVPADGHDVAQRAERYWHSRHSALRSDFGREWFEPDEVLLRDIARLKILVTGDIDEYMKQVEKDLEDGIVAMSDLREMEG